LLLKSALIEEIKRLKAIKPDTLKKNRIKKFSQMGEFSG
jgi:acetyl-CoA carboxylase alpha subunit